MYVRLDIRAGLFKKSEHRIDCKTVTFSPEVDKQRKTENEKQTKTNSEGSPCRVSTSFLTTRISLRWQNLASFFCTDFVHRQQYIHINEVISFCSHPTSPSSLLVRRDRRHQLRSSNVYRHLKQIPGNEGNTSEYGLQSAAIF